MPKSEPARVTYLGEGYGASRPFPRKPKSSATASPSGLRPSTTPTRVQIGIHSGKLSQRGFDLFLPSSEPMRYICIRIALIETDTMPIDSSPIQFVPFLVFRTVNCGNRKRNPPGNSIRYDMAHFLSPTSTAWPLPRLRSRLSKF